MSGRGSRRARASAAVAAGLVALVALGGCSAIGDAILGAGATPSPARTGFPAPSASVPAPTVPAPASPEAPAPEPPAWATYTVPSGLATFELPSDWSAAPGPNGEVRVSDPSGAPRLTYLDRIGGIGGYCEGDFPYETLDAVEIPVASTSTGPWAVTPRIAFRAIQSPAGIVASIGTTDTLAGMDGVTCAYYNLIQSPTAGQMSFGTAFTVYADSPQADTLVFGGMDEARAYAQTEDYRTLMRILASVRT